MITINTITGTDEFHISHDGLPCTVWTRAGITHYGPGDGQFFVPIERNLGRNIASDWHHITNVNAGDFHTPDSCPRNRPGNPPADPGPMLSLFDRSEDGFDTWGYNREGYSREGYSREGYDREGYDREGYDREGYDREGYNRDSYDRDGNSWLADAKDLDLGEQWNDFPSYNPNAFLQHLRDIVRDPDAIDDVRFCDNCDTPEWNENLSSAQGGAVSICSSCWNDWATCDDCDEKYPADDLTEVLSGSDVCVSCRNSDYSYCEDCEGLYRDENADEHDHDSDDDSCCESPQPEFTVRNDGCEPLASDTRVTIALPAGVISAEGLKAIKEYLARQGQYDLSYGLEELGDQWQTKAGNYAKRLSRHAYQAHHVKLTPEIMSQVGVIAREHSTPVSVTIDITRDLNQSAGYFYHEGSCWWNSYSESRCALKTNGGFGLRSFDSFNEVSGRAWMLPLRQDERGKLVPTFDTVTPDAFVAFNGYGDLNGYTAPRIIAHMAGWTYRKIKFSCNPMYVNADGYLIAPEDIAEKYTDGSLYLSVSQHSSLFQTEIARELVPC